jgi:ketosteroid isomerase-like protein
LLINDDWVYGVAEADITLVAHADGTTKSLKANKTWLLRREPSGEWLIKRQMWNYR